MLIGQALSLRYKPVNLDVLPLYITLVLASPSSCGPGAPAEPDAGCLRGVVRAGAPVRLEHRLLSAGHDLVLQPVLLAADVRVRGLVWRRPIGKIGNMGVVEGGDGLAAAWFAFALLIVMTWHIPALEALIPKWMIKAIYPIDKTDLDMLRFTHFLALAVWVTYFFPRHWRALHIEVAAPGHPLRSAFAADLCLSVFLSFSAHWILMQYTRGVWEQLAVFVRRHRIMFGAAWLLDRAERVPNLFVKVTDVDDEPEAAAEGAR